MTILVFTAVTSVCAWWVPRAPAVRELLCAPKREEQVLVLSSSEEARKKAEELGPSISPIIVEIQFDEKDRPVKRHLKVRWRAELEQK